MPEPLDLEWLKTVFDDGSLVQAIIAELEATRAERDDVKRGIESVHAFSARNLDRAERAEAAIARVHDALNLTGYGTKDAMEDAIRAALRGDQ